MTSRDLARSPMEGVLVGWLLERPPEISRLPVGVLSATDVAAELHSDERR